MTDLAWLAALPNLGLPTEAVITLVVAAFGFWSVQRWRQGSADIQAVNTEVYRRQLDALQTSLEQERLTRRTDIEAERQARREDVARLEAHIRDLKTDLQVKRAELKAALEQGAEVRTQLEHMRGRAVQLSQWADQAEGVHMAVLDLFEAQVGSLDHVPKWPSRP